MRITLSPALNDPEPIVEPKRGKKSEVVIDINTDPYEPEKSKGTLTIQANEGLHGGIKEYQRHTHLVALLDRLHQGRQFELHATHTINTSAPREWKGLFEDSLMERFLEKEIGTYEHFVCEQGTDDEPILSLILTKGIGHSTELMWIVKRVRVAGTAAELEEAMIILTDFFAYDPHEDQELFPHIG